VKEVLRWHGAGETIQVLTIPLRAEVLALLQVGTNHVAVEVKSASETKLFDMGIYLVPERNEKRSGDASFASTAVANDDIYLFSYFINEKGIHLAASEDGLHFEALHDGKPIMMPADWEGGDLTRDPSIVYHDGLFHMVWGIAHKGYSFAYAQSKDLVNWSDPLRVFPFGDVQPSLLWAPEITWDPLREELLVVFSWNHVPHVTRSRDGTLWSKAEKIHDLCTSCIDGFLALHETEAGPEWIMIYKDVNSLEAGGKNLRVARIAGDFSGGWTRASEPIIGPGTAINAHAMTEGQSMIKRNGEWWLYWDSPQGGWTGLATSTDLVTWVDRTDELVVPRPAYHGTFFRAPRAAVGWPLPERQSNMEIQ
jgi:hypothetical protein